MPDINKDLDIESEDKIERKEKAIIEVEPGWGWGVRLFANVVNASGVIGWVIISAYLLSHYNGSEELKALRDAMLNIVVPAITYGVITLVSAMTLVSWLFPYFSYRRLVEEGTPIERVGCMLFWSVIALSIAIIISKAINPG